MTYRVNQIVEVGVLHLLSLRWFAALLTLNFHNDSGCRRPERSWISGLLVEVQSVDSTKARTRESAVSGGVVCLQCTLQPNAVMVPLSM